MQKERKGPLESINVRFEKEQGENLKKSIDATRSILDSIGSAATTSDTPK